MLVLRLSSLCRQCPTIGTAARQSLGRPITRRLFTPSKIGAGGDGSRLKQFDWIVKRFKAVDAGATAQQLTRGQEKVIGYWFASVAGLTFATVCAGGLTRLTESGLSMVDWHPFKEVPPSTADQWQAEFEKYQQYPEWKVKNRDITLEQFKFIWHMEYGHRTLGRIIGAVYFLPMAFFWSRGWFNRGLKIRSSIFGTILGLQGLLGWYMVKSGLEEKKTYEHVPRVSQYRLASHLGVAMAFYSLVFWNALTHLNPQPQQTAITASLRRFKSLTGFAKLFVFTTALSGALVAGLDAGLTYNTWPKMADRWVPSDLLRKVPTWKNFFENDTMVQFQHRHLGEFTGLFILGLWAYSLRIQMPRRARIAAHLLAVAATTQMTLGVLNLLYMVPTELASAHQAGAMTTLSIVLWLSNELRWVKKLPK